MALLTLAQITEIQQRAEKATLGPWGWTYDGSGDYSIGMEADPQVSPIINVYGRMSIRNQASQDAEFIAAARQDIPALLAHVAALREERDDLKRETVTSREALSQARGAVAEQLALTNAAERDRAALAAQLAQAQEARKALKQALLDANDAMRMAALRSAPPAQE